MKDSELQRRLADICELSRVKLGQDWPMQVMLMAGNAGGFRANRIVECDGEIVEVTFSKLTCKIESDESEVRDGS